jgi:two-component system NtrC family response regulator
LFLDEITEIPAKCQIDLLRVLETQQYMRVGGEETLRSDVRLISATNKSVANLIEEGSFREDLYYRLNVVPIQIPPLRQRRDDIPLLVEHFLTHFCQRHGRPDTHVAPEAMEKLIAARWPGNIRQLRNMVERLVITVSDDVIHASDIPTDLGHNAPSTSTVRTLAESVEEAERDTITAALASCDYHREKTAHLLGVSVRTLHYKMSRYGLH